MQLSTGKIIDPRLLSYLENTINEYESVSLNISQLKKRLDNFKNMSDNDIRETEAAEARLENYRKTLKEGLKKTCKELNKDLQEHYDHLEKGTAKMISDLNTHKKEFDRCKNTIFDNYNPKNINSLLSEMTFHIRKVVDIQDLIIKNEGLNKDIKKSVKFSKELCKKFNSMDGPLAPPKLVRQSTV